MEEGHDPGHSARPHHPEHHTPAALRARLAEPVRDRLRLATYDETIRFNIVVVERPRAIAVVQPYLPKTRGVDSPTFVAPAKPEPGLFETFTRS